jgi:hypothetical protein
LSAVKYVKSGLHSLILTIVLKLRWLCIEALPVKEIKRLSASNVGRMQCISAAYQDKSRLSHTSAGSVIIANYCSRQGRTQTKLKSLKLI